MKRYSASRIPKPLKPYAFVVLLVAGIIVAVSKAQVPLAVVSASKVTAGGAGQVSGVSVIHVTDGDTIKLSNGEKVRLIGIDTPELHENAKLYRDAERSGQDVVTILNMGRKAYQFTKELLDGKPVRLEFDVQQRDKYGRLLAYVYLEDGTFVNAEIIKNGFAYPMTIPPNVRHADEFKSLFAEAQRAKTGLWKDDGPGHGP